MELEIRSPQPYDLVGGDAVGREVVVVCFVSFGSGGGVHARVRDANGTDIGHANWTPAGSGELGGPYAGEIRLAAVPATKFGSVEFAAGPAGPAQYVVPIVFGSVIMPGYFTYRRSTVMPGDTLWGIAEAEYKLGSDWPFIYEANSYQIADPDLIFPGQRLAIPHSLTTIFHR